MNEDTEKQDEISNRQKIFAIYMSTHPSDPFEAAMESFEGDTDLALDNYLIWLNDDAIIAYTDLHRKASKSSVTNDELIVPTANEISVDAYRISKKVLSTPDESLKALKLVSDIQGYIKKPDSVTNIQVNTANKVMYIRDHGDDWEEKLSAQQDALLSAGDEELSKEENE